MPDLFAQAQLKAPCIIFIDELDALGKARGMGGVMGGHDDDPAQLVDRLIEYYRTRHVRKPSCFCDAGAEG